MASTIGSWVDAATEQEEALASRVAGIGIATATSTKKPDMQPYRPKGALTAAAAAANKDNNVVGAGGGGGDKPGNSSDSSNVEDEEISLAEKSILQKVLRKGLLDTNANLEIKQSDPTNPLYSATSFDQLNLKPELLKGVYKMGFNAPSRIQESALPLLLQNPPQNVIAQSQSGTGKTAAFVLAMLSRVDAKQHYPQVLCLAPTYELALQIGDVVKAMGQFCPEITSIFAVRGVDVERGSKVSEHIIIGTPGKVTDWAFRHRFFDLSRIKVFVLDEADVMIATQGYHDQSIKIHRKLPQICQFMLFSATYDQDVMDFAEKIVPDANILRLRREEESLDNIKQYYINCNTQEDKYRAIANIYAVVTVGQAMIFCQTRKTASWLAAKLTSDGHSVALLSGELTVEQRILVLNRFRDSIEKVLITTNVMARGIDIEKVTLVVNYDIPLDANQRPDCETYLHRIGRTGRFGKCGLAINLVDSKRSMDALNQIKNHFGKPIVLLDPNNVAELEQIDN